VTKSPASLIALLHMVRAPVLGLIKKKIPEAASVLKGDRKGAIESLFKERLVGDRLVVSTDLTAASDRIPHDAA